MKRIGIAGLICVLVFAACLDKVEAQGFEETHFDACYQGPDPGYCRASIPRYYYNARSGRCLSFIYGGCGGNRNNFDTFNSCQLFRSDCLRRRALF